MQLPAIDQAGMSLYQACLFQPARDQRKLIPWSHRVALLVAAVLLISRCRRSSLLYMPCPSFIPTNKAFNPAPAKGQSSSPMMKI